MHDLRLREFKSYASKQVIPKEFDQQLLSLECSWAADGTKKPTVDMVEAGFTPAVPSTLIRIIYNMSKPMY